MHEETVTHILLHLEDAVMAWYTMVSCSVDMEVLVVIVAIA